MRNLFFGLILMISFGAQASAPACARIFRLSLAQRILQSANPKADLIAFLRDNPSISAFVKDTQNGQMPVVLVNDSAIQNPELKELIDSTVASGVQMQPGSQTDHGLIRVGHNLIDRDLPNQRWQGEINATGIALRNVPQLVGKGGPSQTSIETAFVATPGQRADFLFYQMVRRAALFRIPWFMSMDSERSKPGLLENLTEHCYVYSKGWQLHSVSQAIRSKISTIVQDKITDVMADPSIHSVLNQARQTLLNSDPNSSSLRYGMFDSDEYVAPVLKKWPQLDRGTAHSLLNWLISLDATLRYKAATKELSWDEWYGFERDKEVPSALAIFVYSRSNLRGQFDDAPFALKGSQNHWMTSGSHPLPQKPPPNQ